MVTKIKISQKLSNLFFIKPLTPQKHTTNRPGKTLTAIFINLPRLHIKTNYSILEFPDPALNLRH